MLIHILKISTVRFMQDLNKYVTYMKIYFYLIIHKFCTTFAQAASHIYQVFIKFNKNHFLGPINATPNL